MSDRSSDPIAYVRKDDEVQIVSFTPGDKFDCIQQIGEIKYPPRWIVSIDMGFKNLGLIIYDIRSAEVVEWTLVDVGVDSFNKENVAYAAKSLFDNKISPIVTHPRQCRVLLERQVPHPNPFKVLMTECAIRGILLGNNSYFGMPAGESYGARKRRAVAVAREALLTSRIRMPDLIKSTFETSRKKDDMTDAYLQLVFALETKITS
jgi:hypothetical protein